MEDCNLQRYAYGVEDIFLLIYRSFDGMWLLVPIKLAKVFVDMYLRNVDCVYNGYSHLTGWRQLRAIASCDTLRNRYAVVRYPVQCR